MNYKMMYLETCQTGNFTYTPPNVGILPAFSPAALFATCFPREPPQRNLRGSDTSQP